VTNWPEYDGALQRRGSLTVWVTSEALAAWHPPKTGRRGRSPRYAAIAIETGHLLRLAFGRPWRQTEGLLRSLAALLGVGIGVPDWNTATATPSGWRAPPRNSSPRRRTWLLAAAPHVAAMGDALWPQREDSGA
jgi:hypothetical protein